MVLACPTFHSWNTHKLLQSYMGVFWQSHLNLILHLTLPMYRPCTFSAIKCSKEPISWVQISSSHRVEGRKRRIQSFGSYSAIKHSVTGLTHFLLPYLFFFSIPYSEPVTIFLQILVYSFTSIEGLRCRQRWCNY